MKFDVKKSAQKHPKIKWWLTGSTFLSILLIPLNVLDKGFTVKHPTISCIYMVIAMIIVVPICISCYRNEKNGGTPNKIEQLVNTGIAEASILIKHPIKSIKARFSEIKNARGEEKRKKIISLVLGIIVTVALINIAFQIIACAIVLIIALGLIAGGGKYADFITAVGREPESDYEYQYWKTTGDLL